MAEENDKEYSSFCSSCNSMLQSTFSIGIPSIFELNDECNVTQTEKHIHSNGNANPVNKNTTELLRSKHSGRITFDKNICNSTRNSLIIAEPHICERDKIIQKDYPITSRSMNKKQDYIGSLHVVNTNPSKIISTKRLNSKNTISDNTHSPKIMRINHNSEEKTTTLFDIVKNKDFVIMKHKWDDTLNYETLPVAKQNKIHNRDLIGATISGINDDLVNFSTPNAFATKVQNKTGNTVESILNHRKRIIKKLKSILYLCDHINGMRKIILHKVNKKMLDKNDAETSIY